MRGRVALFLTCLLVLAVAVVAIPTTAQAGGPSIVIEPASTPFGLTYGQWSARWWQYMFSIAVPLNPLKDSTGAHCGVGQGSGPVFFLGGLYGESGTVTRTCAVPRGRAVFFPVTNAEIENTVMSGPPTTYTVAELRTAIAAYIDGAHDLSASADGENIAGLSVTGPYRAGSPPFTVVPPNNNLLQNAGYIAPGGQPIYPVLADGVYLMLIPPSPGWHTLHFHGENAGFVLDVTYHLVVS